MELKDFSQKDQEAIKKGLLTAEITDQEAYDKILALVPEAWMKKIPVFVRKRAATKTVDKIAREHPDLYAAAKQPGEIPEPQREELRVLICSIFEDRMNRHNIH